MKASTCRHHPDHSDLEAKGEAVLLILSPPENTPVHGTPRSGER